MHGHHFRKQGALSQLPTLMDSRAQDNRSTNDCSPAAQTKIVREMENILRTRLFPNGDTVKDYLGMGSSPNVDDDPTEAEHLP